jgi:hypothetical protein
MSEPIKGITETVSENAPKSKRGRPKSSMGEYAQRVAVYCDADSDRSKMNFAFLSRMIGMATKLPDEQCREVIGSTGSEIRSGEKKLGGGFATAAIQIVRWIDSHGTEAEALDIIADARRKSCSWRIIGNHFRNLRLGKKQANPLEYFAKCFDKFAAQNPDVSRSQMNEALEALLALTHEPQE